jgi:hypothetical protein
MTAMEWRCVTCGQPASGSYCSGCGERRPELSRAALAHLFADAFESVLHLDAKLLVSLRALVTRPGDLTRDYIRGRRKPFVPPLQLFLFCNLIFFVVEPRTGLNILAPPLDTQLTQSYGFVTKPITERYMAKHRLTIEALRGPYYRTTEPQARSLVGLMVPLFAILLTLVEWRARRPFVEHVIFSLHLYAAWLLWLSAALIVTALIIRVGHVAWTSGTDRTLAIVEFGAVAAYGALALPATYGERRWPAVAKAALLAVGSYFVMVVYRFILFFTTLAAS